MKWRTMFVVVFFSFSGIAAARADQNKVDVVDRLNSSTATIQRIVHAPDKGIPHEVLKGAKCVAVVPNLLKGGFIFGAERGRGLSTCRLPNGQWSAPAFFTITGGNWGLQIGVENVQLVMMIMNDDGMRHLLQNKFQIGGNASAAAGPIGRHASAGTDWKVGTEILTYSRAHGLFAGIDLDGSWVTRDKGSTVAMYGKDYTTTQILIGEVAVPEAAHGFLAEVQRARSRDYRAS